MTISVMQLTEQCSPNCFSVRVWIGKTAYDSIKYQIGIGSILSCAVRASYRHLRNAINAKIKGGKNG